MLALRRSKNAYVDAPYSLVAGLKTESRQNFTNTGRNGPRVKTKTVLKPVNKKEQLGGMPKMKKDKNPNKNPPNGIFLEIEYDESKFTLSSQVAAN